MEAYLETRIWEEGGRLEIDEKRLIERASSGDPEAFNRLMANHERRMYAVALRLCANREDAQDCLQEAMLRVYRAIGGFKGESSFSTWLYRITTNTCLDELRRRKNKQSASLDDLLEDGWAPADERGSPEGHAVRAEANRVLRQAIRELPEDMRAAVVLRDIQGCAYEEIAQALNINVGTIKSRISRGREKLREKLKQNPELFDTAGV